MLFHFPMWLFSGCLVWKFTGLRNIDRRRGRRGRRIRDLRWVPAPGSSRLMNSFLLPSPASAFDQGVYFYCLSLWKD